MLALVILHTYLPPRELQIVIPAQAGQVRAVAEPANTPTGTAGAGPQPKLD